MSAAASLGGHSALFEQQASLYAQYRPDYPDSLYATILEFAGLAQRELALDVATGSGQVAVVLAQQFDQVIACDSSQGQLNHATQRPNIRYMLAPAEHLPGVPSSSVDLATAAQCFHWFEFPQFFREMRRVLKPEGTLAIWGYSLHRFASPPGRNFPAAALAEANRLLDELYSGTLHAYWDAKRQLVDRRYRGLEPGPAEFATVQRRDLSMHRDLSLNAAMGYLSSWSSYAAYRRQHLQRADPLVSFKQQLKAGLQIEDEQDVESLRLEWPLFLILAKQPVPVPAC